MTSCVRTSGGGPVRWRSASSCLAATLLAGFGVAAEPDADRSSEGSPATEARRSSASHATLGLDLDVSPEIDGCPAQYELAAWVDQLVGRPFVSPGASSRVRVVVQRASETDTLVALHLEPTGTDGAPSEPLRTLRAVGEAESCEKLLRAAALTISLLAAPEPSATTAEPTESASPTEPAPSTPSSDEPAPPPRPDASRVEDDAPSGTESSPTSETSIGVTTTPRDDSGALDVGPALGVRAGVAAGQNPGVGLGGSLVAGVRLDAWSVALAGAFFGSTGSSVVVDGRSGVARGHSVDLRLVACRYFRDRFVRACPSLGHLWLFASGEGLPVNRSQISETWTLGGEAGLSWHLGSGWRLGAVVELHVPLRPVEFRIVGSQDVPWSMWPILPRLSLNAEWF